MPMKLSLGLCKKLGLPDYGSLGATCHLELELDQMLLHDLDAFHQQVQDAYAACRQAVQDELARERPPATVVAQCAAAQSGSTPEATTSANHQPGSHGNSNGNGSGSAICLATIRAAVCRRVRRNGTEVQPEVNLTSPNCSK